ncbi:CAP domain-containing protein [Salisediminibacterium selenitireducens]|uniref:SCP-like extracellular n=1 Tax=Bacillus selenitireducens (strain ATCC 700615 / DSM 15326 / MLS10) TaxID=439292 RepID=D6XTK4_BACIE|nr:CAP-associated domain-containing protein [Salisediminibacterium selenitireducens]ADH99140.1 SCP-like extracellular [[Bacillus] selenitireducens MLS10]
MIRILSVITSFIIVFTAAIIVMMVFEEDREPDGNRTLSDSEDVVGQTDFDVEGIKAASDLIEAYGAVAEEIWTPYGYKWWLFDDSQNWYGVQDGEVVTSLILDEADSLEGLRIGDSYESAMAAFGFSLEVETGGLVSSFTFTLSDEELRTKPLAELDDGRFVQLYFDAFDGRLVAVRMLTEELLLLQRPYSLSYRGSLDDPEALTVDNMSAWQTGQEKLMHELSNVYREQKSLPPLDVSSDGNPVARGHSEDMFDHQFFAHDSPNTGSLGDRLDAEGIPFSGAAENIAAHYIDSIEAVTGWLNSEGHRVNLLSEEFTHLASGVHEYYYTQNFILYR